MSFWKFNVQVLLILLECWAFCKENKNSHKNKKTGKISPYIVWGAFKAEGLCFYFVSYATFTGALCSHGACVVLLCCFGKAERVDFFFDVLAPSCLAARSSFRCQQRILLICRLQSQLKPWNARHCLVWQQDSLPHVCSHGSSELEHLAHSRQVRTGRLCPWHSFQSRMNELSFELLNYKFLSWPSCRGGWDEGEKKELLREQGTSRGVQVWVVGAADLPNPLEFTPPSWLQLGNLAGFGCLVPGKAHLECLVSPTNPQLSD